MYLVFAGENYYPLGGWKDFKGCSEDIDKAVAIKDLAVLDTYCKDWWQIVDSDTCEVVAELKSIW